MLDIAIIGAGPAGLSAAINGVQRNKTVKVFGKPIHTSFLYKAEKVDNYLGMSEISGKEMMETFLDHALKKGVSIHQGRVLQLFSMGDFYSLNVDNEFFEAKTVIIATGVNQSKSLPGEEEFLGKGVSYCATCDGMLYKKKKAAILSETEEGEEDMKFLSEICEKVYYLPASKMERLEVLPANVELVEGKMEKILGDTTVGGFQAGGKEFACDGVFLIKETTPVKSMIYGLEMDRNAIVVNRFMETNLPNLYAAGDCTGRPFQVSKAVGEGLIAAQQAVAALGKRKE